jgi:hypothetical protein
MATKGAGYPNSGPAPAKARNRTPPPGKPPFGGPKGKGGIPTPKTGGSSKKAPLTGPMSGLRGRQK